MPSNSPASTLDLDALSDPTLHELVPPGHGTQALGPSDSSDSGSDLQGLGPELGDDDLDSDSDRNGTGERGSALGDRGVANGRDIDVDHIATIDTLKEGMV